MSREQKKYDRAFFGQFTTTTLEKINNLLETYELIMQSADLFILDFPKEAIDTMKLYKDKVKELLDKDAIFYVIATNSSFSSVTSKRDPILLAQSPFGFYYDILGAWDEEMLVLSKL